MARKAFFSFHYQLDAWRVSQIRNMGLLEGQPLLSSNHWEDVAAGGEAAIQKWIDAEMAGKSCNVVLIGSQTAGRKWVNYEFKKAWGSGKGVLGIHIHKLLDRDGRSSTKGANPFTGFTLNNGKVPFDSVVPIYDPAGSTSTNVYGTVANNLESWVENAIAVRKQW